MVDNVTCKIIGPSIQNEHNSVQCNSEYDHENDECNIPESIMDSSQCIPFTLMDCDSSCFPSEDSQCISSISAGCDIHHSLSTLTGHDGYHYICTCCHCPYIKRNVLYFNTSKYDMTNEIVQKALPSQFTDRKMCEVICKPCHKSMHDECPIMPACVHYCNMVWIYSVAQLGTCVHVCQVALLHLICKQFHLTSLITIMMHMSYEMFHVMQIQMKGYVKM